MIIIYVNDLQWLTIILFDLQWFTLIYSDLSGYIDLQWFAVIYSDLKWFCVITVIYSDLQVIYSDLQWFCVIYSDLQKNLQSHTISIKSRAARHVKNNRLLGPERSGQPNAK